MNNFGVELFFDAFCELAPPPGARAVEVPVREGRGGEARAGGAEGGLAGAAGDGAPPAQREATAPFSAYVFKIQANMDRRHRDVLAFMRVCSGVFEPDLMVRHERLGKPVRLTRPHSMVAQARETLDVAYPGDVVGLINREVFRIGDTLSADGGFAHQKLPAFQPEHFARISPRVTSDRKRFDKGLEQLIAEGTVQRLAYDDGDGHSPLVAAVGRLQFEVLQYRLRDEYGVETVLTQLPYQCSAWLEGDFATFKLPMRSAVARDAQGRRLLLFVSEWDKKLAARENPDHRLLDLA
jgi:peptide chain release factor 3